MVTSYNLGATSVSNIPGEAKQHHSWTTEQFNAVHLMISIWGTVALHAEYKLNNRISLLAGPSVQYMITSLLKEPSHNPLFNASQRNYAINFDLGVNIKL